MSYIEVTGKTEEEAVRKALTQLGLERDDVSLEILERAKSGFLGIGSSPARVRVTYGQQEPEAPAAPVQPEKKPEKKPEPKPQPKPQQLKPQKAEASTPGMPASASVGTSGQAGDRRAPVWASAVSAPPSTWRARTEGVATARSTSPATAAVWIGPPPR